jgi:arsenate reductase-like glutaredoxin family protein
MGAQSAGSKPSAKDAALFAALLTEQSCIARRALVDDGRLWETASKAELEFVGWSLTETEAPLAAGI